MDLRSKIIKLAYENPSLRKELLPLLKEASPYPFGDRWDSPHGLEVTPYHDPDDMEKYRPKVKPRVGDRVQIVFGVNLDYRLKGPRRNPKDDHYNGMMGTVVKGPIDDRFYKVELENGEVREFHDIDIKRT